MNTEYLKYSIEDLAQDDQFVRWVQSGRPDGPWTVWLDNHPDLATKADAAGNIITAIRYKHDTPTWDTDALWKKINTSIDEDDSPVKEVKIVSLQRRQIMRWVSYAAAAAVIGVFAFQLWMSGDQNLYVPKGEALAHMLPDQSSVNINADSKINYNETNWDEARRLTLDGEAYFDVKKGAPFSVETERGIVTVLGTSFNVYSRTDGFRVHCTSGRVQVQSNDDTVILEHGDHAVLSADGTLELDKKQSVEWLKGSYRFTDVALTSVLDAIERQFDVTILSESIEARRFTGTFMSDDLSKALDAICFPMKLDADVQGKKIYISPLEN